MLHDPLKKVLKCLSKSFACCVSNHIYNKMKYTHKMKPHLGRLLTVHDSSTFKPHCFLLGFQAMPLF